jgi:hypothetical protein
MDRPASMFAAERTQQRRVAAITMIGMGNSGGQSKDNSGCENCFFHDEPPQIGA